MAVITTNKDNWAQKAHRRISQVMDGSSEIRMERI